MARGSMRLMVGAAVVGAGVACGTAVIVGALRRRRKRRVLPRRVRREVVEAVEAGGGELLGGHGPASLLFERRVERLDDRQLVVLFALVQVGRFAREVGIDPMHPSKEQVAEAVDRFAATRRDAPSGRSDLIEGIRLADDWDSLLTTALRVLVGMPASS